jgi:hypothetical protein
MSEIYFAECDRQVFQQIADSLGILADNTEITKLKAENAELKRALTASCDAQVFVAKDKRIAELELAIKTLIENKRITDSHGLYNIIWDRAERLIAKSAGDK